jgi:hypothetical protein
MPTKREIMYRSMADHLASVLERIIPPGAAITLELRGPEDAPTELAITWATADAAAESLFTGEPYMTVPERGER